VNVHRQLNTSHATIVTPSVSRSACHSHGDSDRHESRAQANWADTINAW